MPVSGLNAGVVKPIFLLPVFAVLALFSGCALSPAEFTETEEGRVSRVPLAAVSNPLPLSSVAPGRAVALANRELERRVRHTDRWSLTYCREVSLRSGLTAHAVRFDRKGAYEDERAGDRFAKFYVLADGRVLTADITYAE